MVSDEDVFFTWGTGKAGQLGSGGKFNSQLARKLDLPPELAGTYSQVATAPSATYILTNNTVYSFGASKDTILGRNNFDRIIDQVQLPNGYTDKAIFIAANTNHCLVATDDGTLFGWGDGKYGQLVQLTDASETKRDSNETKRSHLVDSHAIVTVPQQISIKKPIVMVACGTRHSLALASDGDVFSWGDGSNGRLGLGNSESQSLPTRIPTLGYASSLVIVQIVSGDSHSMALTEEGRVLSWGSGNFGRLGHGAEIDHLTPKSITGIPSKVWFIACNTFHSLAITSKDQDKKSNSLYMWGCGKHGKLGGSSNKSLVPRPVSYFATHNIQITQAACGLQFTTALADDGRMFAWGQSQGLCCGVPTVEDIYEPVSVDYGSEKCSGDHASFLLRMNKGAERQRMPQGSHVVTDIASGLGHNLARTEDGSLYAWGANEFGQLGSDGESLYCPTPISIKFNRTPAVVTEIACGHYHSLAIVNGNVFVWGSNSHGQLGFPSDSDSVFVAAPKILAALQGTLMYKVSAGACHSGALGRFISSDTNGSTERLFTWGSFEGGQLGVRTDKNQILPCSVDLSFLGPYNPESPFMLQDIALGSHHSLLLTNTGVFEAGGGKWSFDRVDIHQSRVVSISAGGNNSIALTAANELYVWGEHQGLGLGRDAAIPVKIEPIGVFSDKTFKGSACGISHCLVYGTSFIISWGKNEFKKLGILEVDVPEEPVIVQADWSKSVIKTSCGDLHSLALGLDGTPYSWGCSSNGRLGHSESSDLMKKGLSAMPAPIAFFSAHDTSKDVWLDSVETLTGKDKTTTSKHGNKEMLMKLQSELVDQLRAIESNRLVHKYYHLRASSAVDSRIKVTYDHMPTGYLRTKRKTQRTTFVKTKLVDAGNSLESFPVRQKSIEKNLSEILSKLYTHPCVLARIGEKIIDTKSSDGSGYSTFVFDLWDANIAAENEKIKVLLKLLLTRHVRLNSVKNPREDVLMKRGSLYWLLIERLFENGEPFAMAHKLSKTWQTQLESSYKPGLDDTIMASNLAQEMFQKLISSKQKKDIHASVGWLAAFLVDQLRSKMVNVHEYVAFKLIDALCEFTKRNMVIDDPNKHQIFLNALDILCEFARDACFRVFRVLRGNNTEKKNNTDKKWASSNLRDFVIDISSRQSGAQTELVTVDHIASPDHKLFISTTYLQFLSSQDVTESTGINLTDTESTLPVSIDFCVLPSVSVSASISEDPLVECPNCHLWMSDLKGGSNELIDSDLTVAESKLNGSCFEMNPLDCAVLFGQLKMALDRNTIQRSEETLLERLNAQIGNLENDLTTQITTDVSRGEELLLRFKALTKTKAVINEINESVNNRTGTRHIPVELFREQTVFFVASIHAASANTLQNKTKNIFDSVMHRLSNALETIVSKDSASQKLMDEKIHLYTECVNAATIYLSQLVADTKVITEQLCPSLIVGETHPSLVEFGATYESTVKSRVKHVKALPLVKRITTGWETQMTYSKLRSMQVLERGARTLAQTNPDLLSKDTKFRKYLRPFLRPTRVMFVFSTSEVPLEFGIKIILDGTRLLYQSVIKITELLDLDVFIFKYAPHEKDFDIAGDKPVCFFFKVQLLIKLLESFPRQWA